MKFFIKHVLLMALCLTAFITTLTSQNLVVNPSFEITNTNCSGFAGEGFRPDLNPSWDNANSNTAGDSCSSPDLFSLCNTIFGFPSPTNMPNSTLGYQYSRTGTRHAGLITYDATGTYREYIQGHTTTPLVAGQVYCVSMYVSLANTMPYATNNIGVYFTNAGYYRDACAAGSLISVTPQLNTPCVITDTTSNWVRLQWSYTAVGGEKYFVIGNFFNNAGTTKVNTGLSPIPNPFAYYYIDDVSIIPNPCCYADIVKVGPLCNTSTAAITMTASAGLSAACSTTIGGTWSGPGIINATTGVFSPTVAGVGVHIITFSLSCGYTATTSIAVSPCALLDLCKETNGTISVSNGVGPYTWSTYTPPTSSPITNQTQCQACGYTWVPFVNQCLNGGTAATSCTTAATWSVFATGSNAIVPVGATQVQIVDGSGTTLTFTPSTVIACTTTASCPTLTMSVSSQTNVNCFVTNTGSATVNATGGIGPYTYTWSPLNLNGPSQTSLGAGIYTVAIKDANQCPGSGTVAITQPTAALSAIISATSSTGCGASTGGATVTVSGGTPSYTYSWNPSIGSTPSVSNLGSGNNTVTVTDSKGCNTTAIANITTAGGPTLAVVSQTNVNCFGASTGTATVNGTGGTGTYTYTWSPGNLSGANQTGLSAGIYTINISDANLCASSGTLLITEPTASLTGVVSNTVAAGCGLSNGSASITASGGTASYTYSWSPNGGAASSASNLSSGANAVTITDSKGCTSTVNVFLTSAGGPTLAVTSQTNVNCFGGNTGSAVVNATGGAGSYTYTWSPGNLIGGNQNSLTAGTYTINVKDANQCAGTGTLMITQPTTSLSASIVNNPTGCGTSVGSATVTPLGGTTPYNYTWSSPIISVGPIATNLAAGNYSVLVIDANGCQITSTTTIISTGGGPSLAVASQTNVLCYATSTGGASINASGTTGPYSYTWSPVGGNSSSASALSAGVYTVTVKDASTCTSTVSVVITEAPPLFTNIMTTDASCGSSDGSATINASGGTGSLTILWQTGSTNNSITGLTPGSYSVVITDANNCISTVNAVVSSSGGLAVDAGTGSTILAGESAQLNATAPSGATITWSPQEYLSCPTCPNTTASPIVTTTYTITADLGGCIGTDTVTIIVDILCGDLYIPTAFSPNGDGQNDMLYVMGNCITNLQFAVFNRWGEKVFETTDPATGWDGTFNGKKLDPAGFAYYLKATVKGEDISKKGNISIVK